MPAAPGAGGQAPAAVQAGQQRQLLQPIAAQRLAEELPKRRPVVAQRQALQACEGAQHALQLPSLLIAVNSDAELLQLRHLAKQ